MNSLLPDLQAIVGSDRVRAPDEDDRFTIDGRQPVAAVAPGTYEEVAAVMRYADAHRLAVIPLGGGRITHVGNVPRQYDIALILSRLTAIIEHEPADLTVTCQAGITVEALRMQLAHHSQMVPLCSPDDPLATVGGALAANSWGPEHLRFGTPRDYTIGLRVVTPDGRTTRAGGRVVKNVAGYDLCKLYIGSLGTLGVIVEATFKVSPIPNAQSFIVVGSQEAGSLCSLHDSLLRKGLSTSGSWIDHYSWGGLAKPYLLWLWVTGPQLAVNRSVREIMQAAVDMKLESWASPGQQWSAGGMSWASIHGEILEGEVSGVSCRLTVLPSNVAELVASLPRSAKLHLRIIPTAGVICAEWFGIDHAQSQTLVGETDRIVRAFGGSAMVSSCALELKRQIDVFGDPPPAFDLMRRVKQQFDPNGILSPGRFVGRL